jgi:hypothetical protein
VFVHVSYVRCVCEYVPHVSTPKHRTCRHSGPITLSCLARSHSLAQHHKCRALSLSPSVWNPPIPTHPPTHKIPTTRFLLGSRQGAFDLLRPHLIERTQIQNHFYIHLRDFRVSGFGFRVKASGCRGWGLGLRSFPIHSISAYVSSGIGFRVSAWSYMSN